ncbi:MAG: two-component system, OmpR family, response regulator [Betaproteobacteria bacterium]|jgi:CheY-like chemotaxis protein|nr:two-component system, OmpR family, response regulator [Betaproteobacteria bacterium]
MNATAAKLERRLARRILVIDDNLDNVRSLALLFHAMGHHVDYAINATAAADMAVSMKPDVIFLDVLLPDGHGANVCKEIRRHSALKRTRIYGVTGSPRMFDLQLALDAGCDDVLRKPVSSETFERLIAGGMHRRKLRDSIADKSKDTQR